MIFGFVYNFVLLQVPSLVKSVHKLMKEKSVKTRQGCFLILTELIGVLPGALAEHIPALIPGILHNLLDFSFSLYVFSKVSLYFILKKVNGFYFYLFFLISGIQFSLGDKQSSSNMKIDTLSFVQHLLQNQGQMPSVFHPHAPGNLFKILWLFFMFSF